MMDFVIVAVVVLIPIGFTLGWWGRGLADEGKKE